MTAGARLGFLGGTLDPVHTGHVETARAAREALRLDRVLFVPSRVPPHKQDQPVASPYHRFAMAALAVNGIEGFEVSHLELDAPEPSYTFDTLARLHETGLEPTQIFFITGADTFAEIATWSRYPTVLDMAHFVVVSRPGLPAVSLKHTLPELSERMVEASVARQFPRSSAIFLVEAQTPNVSSTEIRQRCRSGESIAGLVPPAVESHIRQHGLYSDVPRPTQPHAGQSFA